MPIANEPAHERLLLALAEELKLPLLQIAREAELASLQGTEVTRNINHVAEMALRLVDGYILSLASAQQSQLELEPIAVSSVLYDAAHRLSGLAKQQGYELDIHMSHKYGPIMAERKSLETAFTLLGYGLMSGGVDDEQTVRVTLGAHRSAKGIVAGVFTNDPMLTTDAFRRARVLSGSARQALPGVNNGNGAGVLIADSLFRHLASPLKIARHQRHVGLAATLTQSQQLQLV